MVVAALAAVAEPTAAVPLGVIGWLTAVGFSRPPYADLRLTGAIAERTPRSRWRPDALAVAAVAGAVFRHVAARVTLESVDRQSANAASTCAGSWPARRSPWPGCPR